MLAKEGCALGPYSLKECKVKPIDRVLASEIIMKYEWLQSMPQAGRYYYGLVRPDERVIGAACFGAGPSPQARDFCGQENTARVLCLERGACAPIVPKGGKHADGAASRLIMRACKALVHDTRKDERIGAFFAYSDQAAGELGTVYQAAGWTYIGHGVGRNKKNGLIARPIGRFDYYTPEGERVTSRRMRQKLRREGYPHTLKEWFPAVGQPSGWTRERQHDKHKYVLILAKDMRLDTDRFVPKPYYKRDDILTQLSAGASASDWRIFRGATYQESLAQLREKEKIGNRPNRPY
jgi:hypothetical protein